jgi:hypothetical protein
MEFIGWMYDLAREQSPREELLADWLRRSAAAGYNAVGLYLEHRFAYPSAPWAAGPGCLTPEVVQRLVSNSQATAGPRLIPFLNTLGHMEGFIRAEGGQGLAESEPGFGSAQICATRPECAAFARDLVADILDVFDDEWVHLGGDETNQLGQCPACAERVARVGQGGLYGEYYGPLCRFVLERGRRPCLWGDMLLLHPGALDAIPRETLIFDWQYFSRPRESTQLFRARGFDVVCCPSVQTYNSGWCFLAETQRNIDEHAEDARAAGALGVLVTTWEFMWFTQCIATLPVVLAAGRRLARSAAWTAALVAEGGEPYARAAGLLGNDIPGASAFLKPGTWRQLRDRLVIRQNPFYLWRDWRREACGEPGDAVLRLCAEIEPLLATAPALRFPAELHQTAVEWVRAVEAGYQAYRSRRTAICVASLERGRGVLGRLRPGLENALASGGAVADVERLDLLLRKVDQVCERVKALRAASAYRPSFETLAHDAYVAGDQAGWRCGAYY